MTELIEQTAVGAAGDGSSSAGGPNSPGGSTRRPRLLQWPRALVLLLAVALVAVLVSVGVLVSDNASGAPAVKTISLVSGSHQPKAPPGATDDYHCTLMNPHVTQDSYIISSQFVPGSPEDHHADLALVPPSLASKALAVNAQTGGKGWTCFGSPALPGGSLTQFLSTPLLSVWAPGHGADTLPKGTGIALPVGSLVIMQVHYNLLVGDNAVRDSLVLHTVPITTPLLPLHLDMALATPDLPCPAGVTGPLCVRAASLADQANRFGPVAAQIVDGIEAACGHDPSNPPVGDTASCITTVDTTGYIVRAQAHMHLLGRRFTLILNPGTSRAKTVLSVPNYDFHYQKAYNLNTPVPVKAGEKLQVNCTYDPTLAQELPALRSAPPHFVTWGDGSSDEMCIGLAWISKQLPDSHASV
jgi:Copper type II ascorbate-dependent monooxygenase, C-terminal domain